MNIIKYFTFLVLSLAIASCGNPNVKSKMQKKSTLLPFIFTFSDEKKAIYYTFKLVNDSTKINTLIFFISGSGCSSVKNRFPDYFSPLNGVPAIVYILQKRGIADGQSGGSCSKNFISTDYFEQILKDQKEFISNKISSNKFKYQNIVLIGASEGSIIAAKIAEENPNITHLGLIGSGGASLREDLTLLAKKQLFFYFTLNRNLSSIKNNPNSLTKTAWGHTYKYWSSFLDIDFRNILPKQNIPIIIAMGEQDKSVPIESLKELKNIFTDKGKYNLVVKVYPNADHRLFSKINSKSYASDFLQTLRMALMNE